MIQKSISVMTTAIHIAQSEKATSLKKMKNEGGSKMNAFPKADVYMTNGINSAAEMDYGFQMEILQALTRFMNKDWGITPDDDKDLNDKSLHYKDRILASYQTSEGKIWINAESEDGEDYTEIMIMFPDEY